MNITDWTASFAALFSAVAAFISAIISARWGQQYEKAKNAQIQATEAIIKTKDSQIETLNVEIGLLRDMLSPKIRESFISMREQLEEYNESLKAQLNNAKVQIEEKNQEIKHLQGNRLSNIFEEAQIREREIKDREIERNNLQQKVLDLEKELKDLQELKTITTNNFDLSPRQRQIYDIIEKLIKEKGNPPSLREITKETGTISMSAIHYALTSLVDKGLLKKFSKSETTYYSINK